MIFMQDKHTINTVSLSDVYMYSAQYWENARIAAPLSKFFNPHTHE